MNLPMHPLAVAIRGAGGGGKGGGASKPPVEAPDSLRSIAYARILDLVSEGEIYGFADQTNPLTCVYFNETAVQNADGSKNFINFQIESRTGTQTQSPIEGFSGVESESGVGVRLVFGQPWTRTFTNINVTSMRVRLSVPSLSATDTTNGNTNGTTVNYTIELATDTGAFITVLNADFTGKASNKYERSHLLQLPPATTGWTVRVTRNTPESTSQALSNQTWVEAVTEIIDAKLRLPMSAYIGVIIDAEQFSNIPARAYKLRGRLIRIPSNYNPTTRAYTGVWDGTFGTAYSNNPAWVFYDMATHPRYGLGHLVSSDLIDKWALYKIATYCDEMVATGMPIRATGVTTGSTSLAATATGFTRTAGSFITDGFVVGDFFNATGFANAANNKTWQIATVSALAITVQPSGAPVAEVAAIGRTLTLRSPMEPRFTANVYLQTQQDALKVMQDLASMFRGIMYAAGGAITAVGDMPEDPIYTYTPANVVEGKFTYSGSSRKVRHTVALVSWNDMSDFGRAKVEYVDDQEGIARYGIQPTEVIAVGCTSRGQARRMGKYILTTERYETDLLAFGVGLDGTIPAPGKIVLVADPLRAGRRTGGRLRTATLTTITVDQLPTVEIGNEITVALPNGGVNKRTISGIAGNQITVSVAFDAVPVPQSVWLIESTTLKAQRFRVLGVAENANGIDHDIIAIQHVEGKFDYVENNLLIEEAPISDVMARVMTSPSNIMMTHRDVADTNSTQKIVTLTWSPILDAYSYNVMYRLSRGSWINVGNTTAPSIDILSLPPGMFEVQVTAISGTGVRSNPTFAGPFDITPNIKPPGFLEQVNADIAAALSTAQNAQAVADGAIVSFWVPSPPLIGAGANDAKEGDIWFDTDDGSRIYRVVAGVWTDAQDDDLALALARAADAQATADGKVTTYYQDGPPALASFGDLWIEKDNGNRLWRWNGTAWIDSQGRTVAQALTIVAGVVTIDCAVFEQFTLSLTENVTSVNFVNVPAVRTILVTITMAGVGGYTCNFGPSVVPLSGEPYVPTSTVGAVNMVGLDTTNAGARWFLTAAKPAASGTGTGTSGGGAAFASSIGPSPATATAASTGGVAVAVSVQVTATATNGTEPVTHSWSRADTAAGTSFAISSATVANPTLSIPAGTSPYSMMQTWRCVSTDAAGKTTTALVDVTLTRTSDVTASVVVSPKPTTGSASTTGAAVTATATATATRSGMVGPLVQNWAWVSGYAHEASFLASGNTCTFSLTDSVDTLAVGIWRHTTTDQGNNNAQYVDDVEVRLRITSTA